MRRVGHLARTRDLAIGDLHHSEAVAVAEMPRALGFQPRFAHRRHRKLHRLAHLALLSFMSG